jgi:hypothetical protein
VLLQTLEAQLLEATNAATRAASAGPHQQRDTNIAANLSLDAHRQASCCCLSRTPELRCRLWLLLIAQLSSLMPSDTRCICRTKHSTVGAECNL